MSKNVDCFVLCLLSICVFSSLVFLCFEKKRKFTAKSIFQDAEKHSGFLNEAKEWAGELLSGQTKVNRDWEQVVWRELNWNYIYDIFGKNLKMCKMLLYMKAEHYKIIQLLCLSSFFFLFFSPFFAFDPLRGISHVRNNFSPNILA